MHQIPPCEKMKARPSTLLRLLFFTLGLVLFSGNLTDAFATIRNSAPLQQTVASIAFDAQALALPDASQPCRVSPDVFAFSGKSARGTETDDGNIPQAFADVGDASPPIRPALALTPTVRPEGTPRCFLPAARGLIFFATPPPSAC